MYKIIIPAILAIFALWILLQISLEMSIVKNPMNYFIVFIIFFLFGKDGERKTIIVWAMQTEKHPSLNKLSQSHALILMLMIYRCT